ncbi:NAD(P)H-dependent oxidoreductase [Microbispora amethystogenes]|uniref:NADPH-dependent FMN reductase n=1 Tax=Microbispora amethystogenes TaxID=1427754 RepID=UPI0033DACA4E
MLTIAVILGSTRPGRTGEAVAAWVLDHAARRTDATFELVDLATHDLPDLDEAWPPATGNYSHDHTRAWADTVARYDGYVVVTPEYNHAMPGTLKNALDRVHREWNDKAAAFVSYGVDGGVRAVEQLRGVMGALHVAAVGPAVALSFSADFAGFGVFRPQDRQVTALSATLDRLVAWSGALASLRGTPASLNG